MYQVPKRTKLGVGKKMGTALYFHKYYAYSILGHDLYLKAFTLAKDKFPTFDLNSFSVVKLDRSKSRVSFVQCDGFDKEAEPIVQGVVTVDYSTKSVSHKGFKNNPPIYHHKWLFVKDDYDGFDVERAKDRSRRMSEIDGLDSQKIGNFNQWQKFARKLDRQEKSYV